MSQELDKRTLIIIIMMILILGFFFLFVCFFLFENDFNLRMLESYTLIENDHAGEHC